MDLLHAAFLIKQKAMQLTEETAETVSAGGCHQCQQNYTPRELQTFKAVDIYKAILRRFQRGTLFRTLDTPFFQEVRKI